MRKGELSGLRESRRVTGGQIPDGGNLASHFCSTVLVDGFTRTASFRAAVICDRLPPGQGEEWGTP